MCNPFAAQYGALGHLGAILAANYGSWANLGLSGGSSDELWPPESKLEPKKTKRVPAEPPYWASIKVFLRKLSQRKPEKSPKMKQNESPWKWQKFWFCCSGNSIRSKLVAQVRGVAQGLPRSQEAGHRHGEACLPSAPASRDPGYIRRGVSAPPRPPVSLKTYYYPLFFNVCTLLHQSTKA